MEAKLRSTLKLIPWSLLAKALVFGGFWLGLPWPVFLAVGLYFFFVPLFKPLRFAWPFLILLVFSSAIFLEKNFWLAVIVAVAFYLLLGVKDLILINRRTSYEALVFLLLFLVFFDFFSIFKNWLGLNVVFGSLVVAFVFFILSKNLADYDDSFGLGAGSNGKKKSLTLGLMAFLTWEIVWVLLFLPLHHLYQTSILFISAIALIEVGLAYLGGGLTRRRVLTSFTLFFVFVVLMLVGATWEVGFSSSLF